MSLTPLDGRPAYALYVGMRTGSPNALGLGVGALVGDVVVDRAAMPTSPSLTSPRRSITRADAHGPAEIASQTA